MSVTSGNSGDLIASVTLLRDAVSDTDLPLDIEGRDSALATRGELLAQLDDYVLPRLRSLDAPLLAVVGGSTGAGKSTLVNSIIGVEVSRSGVIRPTTTSPVLVHHPEDAGWFSDRRIFPGLSRVSGVDTGEPQPGTVRLAESRTLPPGMALLDAPDIDSVVSANRDLAVQLLAAADMWLFVTTAARYADAVPWDLLRAASERGTAVAIVLDRVPPEAIEEIRPHLGAMLREQGLGVAPIFAIPETVLTADGLLPDAAMGRLKGWLEALAGDSRARASVVGQTLDGALASLGPRIAALSAATRAQESARTELSTAAASAFAAAEEGVRHGMTDGTLLRGEVLARWQEFVGTGEFFRQMETTISRWRDRVSSAVRGAPPSAEGLGDALQSGVSALMLAEGETAASVAAHAWRRLPGGEALLTARPELARPSADLRSDIERTVRDWQGEVLALVRGEGQGRRTNARIAAYGVNGIGLFLMLVAFAHTGGLLGGEIAIAGGTSVLAQRVLEAIFGDQAVRDMAAKARAALLDRVHDVYAAEQGRYDAVVAAASAPVGQAERLAEAVGAVSAIGRVNP